MAQPPTGCAAQCVAETAPFDKLMAKGTHQVICDKQTY